VGRATDVAIVEADDIETRVDKCADEAVRPAGQVESEAGDEQKRASIRGTGRSITQPDAAGQIAELVAVVPPR
jgi:hypothetical protein